MNANSTATAIEVTGLTPRKIAMPAYPGFCDGSDETGGPQNG